MCKPWFTYCNVAFTLPGPQKLTHGVSRLKPVGFTGLAALLGTLACGGDGGTEPPPPPPPPNQPPQAVGSLSPMTMVAGDTATMDVSASFRDPDGDRLTYSVASSNTGVVAVSASGSIVTLVAVAPGIATLTVTATDSGGLSATQQTTVTVEAPRPSVTFLPAAAAAPEGDIAVLSIVVTPAPQSPISVGYSIGADADPGTEDADTLDYEGDARGTLSIAAGDSAGSIALTITDDDDIEPAREVLLVTLDVPDPGAGYVPGSSASATVTIEEGVCDRTMQVRDEIMRLVETADCTRPASSDLRGLTELRLCGWSDCPGSPVAALREGDFLGLAGLTRLELGENQLATLPARVFSGLSSLEFLDLQHNRLAELPVGLFSDLSNLVSLYLGDNELESLPPAVFEGLTSLRSLIVPRNPGTPFPLTLELQRTDAEDLRAPSPAHVGVRVVEGAPFTIRLPLVSEGGTLSGDTAIIERGLVGSQTLTVTRDPNSLVGTLVAAGPAPVLPDRISGVRILLPDPQYLFQPSAPIVSLASSTASAPEGRTAVLQVEIDPPPESPVTLAYTLGTDDDDASDDAEPTDYVDRSGGTVQIAAGATSGAIEIDIHDDSDIEPTREVFTVSVIEPGQGTGYLLGYPNVATVVIEEGVCDRTPQVRDGIVQAARVGNCSEVDPPRIGAVDRLDLRPGARRTTDEPPRTARYTKPCDSATEPDPPPGSGYAWGPGSCGPEGKTHQFETTQRRAIGAADAITALHPSDFQGLTGLTWLSLEQNRLTTLPPGVFAGLVELRHLQLGENELTGLSPRVFAGLSNLWLLNLWKNRLTELPPGLFAGLTNLRRLFAHENRLTHLAPDAFSGLSSLELLWLNGNQLAELPPDVFAGLPNLKELWVWWNSLTELPPGIFAGLSSLEHLFVSQNQLTELPAGVFAGLTNLTHLGVHQNQISELRSDAFADLDNLYELGLLRNNLVRLPPEVFEGLSKLERLGLQANRLTGLPAGVFSDLASLRELHLANNRLAQLRPPDLAGLTRLELLQLTSNQLAELQPGLFSKLERLQELDLGWNRLRELPVGVFLGLTQLRTLGLDGNPGSPFMMTLEPQRTDSDNHLAAGPATVAIALEPGAPFNITIPVAAHGGAISASTMLLRAGSDQSDEITVTRHSGSQTATQVVAGPPPRLPTGVTGVEIEVADPLVLFATASNRAPVAERPMPWLRMREGGESGSLTVSEYFRDPDGDDLVYTAESADPGVATAWVSGGRVTMDPVAAGSGTVTVTAKDPGGLTADVSLPISVRGGSPGLYDIDLILIDEVSESIQAAFDDAVDYWAAILAPTELPDIHLGEDFELGCWDIRADQRVQTVEEVVIVASVREIDGRGGILASAGFCGLRDGEGGLPFMGAMQFDVDDLEWLEERGDMEEVILHEMGHVFGIGTFWRLAGLLIDPSLPDNQGADSHFKGPLTIAAFDEAGGTDYDGPKVPVENRAGPGSSDTHWRESVLDHELMTPFQNGGIADPLSTITIQSLADLGYQVNAALAEPFRLPGADIAPDIVEPVEKIEYGDDILRGPIIVVDRDGRVVRVIPN